MQKTPTLIQPYGHAELLLGWNDGEQLVVPYAEIRFHCPCAHCVDELTGKRTLQREAVNADIRPLSVEPVGRYALQFRWSDGHTTGIFPYELLYAISTESGQRIRPAREPSTP